MQKIRNIIDQEYGLTIERKREEIELIDEVRGHTARHLMIADSTIAT